MSGHIKQDTKGPSPSKSDSMEFLIEDAADGPSPKVNAQSLTSNSDSSVHPSSSSNKAGKVNYSAKTLGKLPVTPSKPSKLSQAISGVDNNPLTSTPSNSKGPPTSPGRPGISPIELNRPHSRRKSSLMLNNNSRDNMAKSFSSTGASVPRSLTRSIPIRPPTSNSNPSRRLSVNDSTLSASQGLSFATPPSSFGSRNASILTALLASSPQSSVAAQTALMEDNAGITDAASTSPSVAGSSIHRIVQEHLVAPEQIKRGGSPQSFGSVSHNLLGGAMTRDIYQWSEKHSQAESHRRRNSDSDVISIKNEMNQQAIIEQTEQGVNFPSLSDLRASDLRYPGVFRRYFIHTQAQKQGKPKPNFVAGNFLDFLALYGYYGGDVVPEEDSEDDGSAIDPSETEPLLNHQRPHGTPRGSMAVKGTTKSKAFFMVLKAFVGTGVLFLPKAFGDGGMTFSIVVLVFIGWLTLHCMLLLVETSRKMDGLSFGELGAKFYGPSMRQVVLGSIAISQMGQNLKDIAMNISGCEWDWPDWVFILVQLALYIPLSWVRKIKHFSITSLIADVFIMAGLGYVLYFNILTLAHNGMGPDIVPFNFEKFPLFIGTAMFAFEGICLILPIGESMEKPEEFGKTLTWSVVVIGSIFVSVGAIGYAAFGSSVKTVIFLNITPSPLLTTLQFLYAIAIMLSFPLCAYPAIRITEEGLFGHSSGRQGHCTKWTKNIYRACLVSFLGAVAWLESNDLDKFVSLVGCLACIPLSFIYPAMFHLKVATSYRARLADYVVICFGFMALLYTTAVTIQQWGMGSQEKPRECPHP